MTLEHARWWVIRPAQNRKPATYRCPICGRLLPSLSAHVLLLPEGDASRRRHAHSACMMRARKVGRLPLHEDWQALQPQTPSLWERFRRRRIRDRDADAER
jgi:hypothetical protein